MEIGITKTFLSRFEDVVRKNGFLGELIIKALINLKNNNKVEGLNDEFLKGCDYKSIRVTRDYRIIYYPDNNVAKLFYIGNHKDAYRWTQVNKTVYYHNNVIGYWDSSEDEEYLDENQEEESEYSCFNKEFQLRLQACKNSQELLDVCSALAPEYKEIVLSHNSVNNVIEKYSSEILVVDDDEDLKDALEKPFEEWMVFLHPIQKSIIEYPIDKNLSICGGPGTGKTVSLVHRLVSFKERGLKCLLISKSDATLEVVHNMIRQLNESLIPDSILMSDINENNIQELFSKYDYFFFDELQDIGRHECQLLLNEFKKGEKHFSIAYDLNQAIYTTKNKKEIFEFESLADESKILHYNYRCTSEIFLAAADFIRYQYDRLKKDTFAMNFALVGNEVEFLEEDDLDIDLAVSDLVLEKKLMSSGDWAIVFASYYNERRYLDLKNMFPDNVYNVMECKGMDFKAGCVIIYNQDFDFQQKEGFKEYNAQSYVAITRFRDSVSIFLVNEKFDQTPGKNMINIHNNITLKKQAERQVELKEKRLKSGRKARAIKRLKIKKDINTGGYEY